MNLACTATSSALPQNMSTGLDMYYSWTVDTLAIITDTKYTIGGTNSDTLTINNLERDDKNKHFVCKAKAGGKSTEGISSAVLIDVQCKYDIVYLLPIYNTACTLNLNLDVSSYSK